VIEPAKWRAVAARFAWVTLVAKGAYQNSEETLEKDVALFTAEGAMERPVARLGTPSRVRAGDAIVVYGFGRLSCFAGMSSAAYRRLSLPLDVRGFMRRGDFVVERITDKFIYLRGTREQTATCPGDSGAGYFALQDGELKLVATHHGRTIAPDDAAGRSPDAISQGTGLRVDSPQTCELLGRTGIAPSDCAERTGSASGR
jgi:hypothetical protein